MRPIEILINFIGSYLVVNTFDNLVPSLEHRRLAGQLDEFSVIKVQPQIEFMISPKTRSCFSPALKSRAYWRWVFTGGEHYCAEVRSATCGSEQTFWDLGCHIRRNIKGCPALTGSVFNEFYDAQSGLDICVPKTLINRSIRTMNLSRALIRDLCAGTLWNFLL